MSLFILHQRQKEIFARPLILHELRKACLGLSITISLVDLLLMSLGIGSWLVIITTFEVFLLLQVKVCQAVVLYFNRSTVIFEWIVPLDVLGIEISINFLFDIFIPLAFLFLN